MLKVTEEVDFETLYTNSWGQAREVLLEIDEEDMSEELMDFLEDPEAEEFVMEWNQEVFEEGKVGLEEGEFYPYPRY